MTPRRMMLRTGLALAATAPTAALFARIAHAEESHILTELQKRGTIRIATVAGNPPYSSFRPDGTPEGYDIEIGQQLAAALKVKPEWIVVDSPGRITALQTGKADASVANFTATIERSTAIAFTRPYLIVGSNYMVKKDSPLQNVEQANKPNIKIGVPRGGTSEDIAAKTTPAATVVKFNTVTDAFLALKSGQVDAHIVDSLQDAAFLAKEGANFRNLPGNWSYEEISIGVPSGDADWLRIVDTFVRQLIGSGEDARLFKKYFGYDMPPL
jgi:polar amino acid transport system substrate-binding protein